MAMIFQNFNLVERHSVLKNVLAGRLAVTPTWKSLLGLFTPKDHSMANDNLKLLGIAEKAALRSGHLSGGQQQRVAIARALTQQPKLLLADEPVASLDPATCHAIMDYLQKVNRELGLTIICNLHFLSLVKEYATRVIALRAGEIVYEGSASTIDSNWFKKIYGEAARDIHVD
jgi:phosphonate transport system ATP-binding protein